MSLNTLSVSGSAGRLHAGSRHNQGRTIHVFSARDIFSPDMVYTGAPTVVRVSLFVAAMGLRAVPIDPSACKGVTSAFLDVPGSSTINITALGWQQSWVTAGDVQRVYDPNTPPDALPWQPVNSSWPPAFASSVWFRAYIPTPPNATAFRVSGPVPQSSVALSLIGMSKGVAYVNGWHLGVSCSLLLFFFYVFPLCFSRFSVFSSATTLKLANVVKTRTVLVPVMVVSSFTEQVRGNRIITLLLRLWHYASQCDIFSNNKTQFTSSFLPIFS